MCIAKWQGKARSQAALEAAALEAATTAALEAATAAYWLDQITQRDQRRAAKAVLAQELANELNAGKAEHHGVRICLSVPRIHAGNSGRE